MLIRNITILALALFIGSTINIQIALAQNQLGHPANSTEDAQWFKCESDSDCVFALDHCAYRSANRNFKKQFEEYALLRDATIGPTFNCIENMQSQLSATKPICKDGSCSAAPRI